MIWWYGVINILIKRERFYNGTRNRSWIRKYFATKDLINIMQESRSMWVNINIKLVPLKTWTLTIILSWQIVEIVFLSLYITGTFSILNISSRSSHMSCGVVAYLILPLIPFSIALTNLPPGITPPPVY